MSDFMDFSNQTSTSRAPNAADGTCHLTTGVCAWTAGRTAAIAALRSYGSTPGLPATGHTTVPATRSAASTSRGGCMMQPQTEPRWMLSHRAAPQSVAIADRHYSRQQPGTPQFVKPGRCLVLRTPESSALWVTSWPFAEYVNHAWGGRGSVPSSATNDPTWISPQL